MELVTPSLGLLVWTSVIFLILLVILSKYAWKPIVAALDEREKFISDSLNSAENAKTEMALLKSENENLLQQARIERDKILKDAQMLCNSMIADAKEKATIESDKIVSNARVQIIAEKNAAIFELKNLVATTSLDIAEQVLKRTLSDVDVQKQLVQEYVKDIQFN